MTPRLPRRAAMLAAAASLATPALVPRLAQATETPKPMQTPPPQIPLYRVFSLGDWTVTPLLAGTGLMENPQGTFGTNATAEEFAKISQAAFIPHDIARSFMVPTLVDTGTDVVLFDTGMTPEGITRALAAAGRSPDEVTVVILTHMHPDHIGGLMADDTPVFPKARYLTGQIEWDHWSKVGSDAFDAKVKPLHDKISFLSDGQSPLAGITAHLAPGHTPGHMVFHLESAGAGLMLTADTANHYVWSLGQPDWHVRFDLDKSLAAKTRHSVFGKIADERLPFIGYHMPFPALGFVERQGEGFRFIAASYQLNLKA